MSNELAIFSGGDHITSAKEIFRERLPGRDVVISLASRDPTMVANFLDVAVKGPDSFFGLLGSVSEEDCMFLLELIDLDRLWEDISSANYTQVGAIALRAKKALGEENLQAISISLLDIDRREVIARNEQRFIAGIYLASALPPRKLVGIFGKYSNLARMETNSRDCNLLAKPRKWLRQSRLGINWVSERHLLKISKNRRLLKILRQVSCRQ